MWDKLSKVMRAKRIDLFAQKQQVLQWAWTYFISMNNSLIYFSHHAFSFHSLLFTCLMFVEHHQVYYTYRSLSSFFSRVLFSLSCQTIYLSRNTKVSCPLCAIVLQNVPKRVRILMNIYIKNSFTFFLYTFCEQFQYILKILKLWHKIKMRCIFCVYTNTDAPTLFVFNPQ